MSNRGREGMIHCESGSSLRGGTTNRFMLSKNFDDKKVIIRLSHLNGSPSILAFGIPIGSM
jgi:hypothetical protein